MIGGKAPSQYLAAIQSHKQVGLSEDGMNAILACHYIDPKALRSDSFDSFFQRRREALLQLVEDAMGKSIDRGIEHSEDQDEPDDNFIFIEARA